MTSISEAIFKGQIRPRGPAPSQKPIQAVMTEQLLARRAIEAVLAGGYTRCDEAPQQAPASAKVSPLNNTQGIARYLLIWLGVFVLAGAIAIGTSRLPGHAVQAKPADRSAIQAESQNLEVEGTEAEAAEEIPSTVSAPSVASIPAPAQPPSPMVAAASLLPIKKQISASSLSVTSLPSTVTGTPDDRPMGKSALAIEEVLYEGEPAVKSAPEPASSAITRIARKPGASAPRESDPAPQRTGSMKVEGIFWDKVRPMAIVNGDIVEIGSQVGEYKVADIKPGIVTLTDGQDRLTLRP